MTARSYFWIVTADSSGKLFLVFGSDVSSADAEQKGLELLGGADFRIKRLPTRDLGRASSLLKGNRLSSTHSLEKASQKLGHEKSLKRAIKKARQSVYSGPEW